MAGQAVREAGDRSLASYLAGYQGMVRADDAAEAAAWLASAVETAPRSLSGAASSWLSALYAEAAARIGDRRAALASLDQGTKALSGPRSGHREAWMYEFDQGSLAMRTGFCLVALGQSAEALTAFDNALGLLPAGRERRYAEFRWGWLPLTS